MARGDRRKRSSANAAEAGSKGVWQTAIVRHSDAFESFYKEQNIVPPEEWGLFIECLKSDLPTAFRVVAITPHHHYLHSFLQKTMDSLKDATPEDVTDDIESPTDDVLRCALQPLTWYKRGNEAFQLNVSRHVLRSCKPLLSLHRFLVAQSEAATLYRQEAVSMIPALFLEQEMRGASLVLDMCAAPGSKTSQLLEALHQAAERERQSDDKNWPALPSFIAPSLCASGGAIVANDFDVTRSHMLVHHLRHLHSPCLLVTSHAAQFFPTVFYPPSGGTNNEWCTKSKHAFADANASSENNGSTNSKPLVPIQFDGVLCDAPCSGDGTLRKSRGLWASWSPHQGLGCHRLQVQILLRGIKLCKIGGRIVYSTCTFNPIENEAVVYAAIAKSRGAVELEDCSEDIPSLKRSPGLKTWRVEWEGRWYGSYEEVPKTAKAAKKVWPSMFPPPQAPDAIDVPLHRCMRFLPHVNNTGGFFVAVLRKVKDVPLALSSSAGSEKTGDCKSASSDSASETANTLGAGNTYQDDTRDAEEPQGNVDKDTACTTKGNMGAKLFDQMQLDMIGLDWQSEALERQHQQLLQQEERLQSQAEQQGGKQDVQSGNTSSSESASAAPKRDAQPPRLPVCRCVLEQTRELAFRTLNLSEGITRSDSQLVLQHLCSLLYCRLKTNESSGPGNRTADQLCAEGNEHSADSDRHPRRLFLVSQGVKRLVEAVGSSRYKIINGGCLAFQARSKGVYRIAYGGAQWLAPFYEEASRLGAVTGDTGTTEVAQSGLSLKAPCRICKGAPNNAPNAPGERLVFDVPCELLYALLNTGQEQRRVDLSKLEDVPFGNTLVRESKEGPLLFLAKLPPAVGRPECTPTKIAIPAWRGRANVELLLDPNTRCALKCLIEGCCAGNAIQKQK